jgi:protein involved in polysaccharide export with SLBB domain
MSEGALRRIGCPIVLTWSVLAAVGCASGGSQDPSVLPETRTDVAPLEPGDAIEVRFSREPDQNGTYDVDQTGSVALPFLGSRDVSGIAPSELQAGLIEAYQGQLRNQTVQVRLLRRVRVLGAVRSPGLYRVDATMALADIIAMAGGATEDGKLEDTRIQREDGTVRVDVERGAGVYTLESGDQVYVPLKSWFVRNSAVLAAGFMSAVTIIVVNAIY